MFLALVTKKLKRKIKIKFRIFVHLLFSTVNFNYAI